MAQAEMRRSVGVAGVVVTLVGFVIGVSIFILPGALAATAGPAVVLSYFVAGLIALFSCVVAAQIGAVLPTSGASFVATSRLLSPFLGFATIWLIIGGSPNRDYRRVGIDPVDTVEGRDQVKRGRFLPPRKRVRECRRKGGMRPARFPQPACRLCEFDRVFPFSRRFLPPSGGSLCG